MVAAVLDSGRSPPGCVALLLYAIFFNVRLKRYEQGYTLGKTGMAILERLQDQSKRGQVLLTFSSAVAHWVQSMQVRRAVDWSCGFNKRSGKCFNFARWSEDAWVWSNVTSVRLLIAADALFRPVRPQRLEVAALW
jgi:hypothetical protein